MFSTLLTAKNVLSYCPRLKFLSATSKHISSRPRHSPHMGKTSPLSFTNSLQINLKSVPLSYLEFIFSSECPQGKPSLKAITTIQHKSNFKIQTKSIHRLKGHGTIKTRFDPEMLITSEESCLQRQQYIYIDISQFSNHSELH